MSFNKIVTNEKIHYQCITVNKSLYRNWVTATKEEAFYKTLTQLVSKIVNSINDDLIIECDEKNDRYDKHHEVCQIIANYLLKHLPFKVKAIKSCNSKKCEAIQIADYITGAINASHRYYKNRNIEINPGKCICIKLLSSILGWEDLACDTWPNDKFNIWAFPIESRAPRGVSKNFNIYALNYPTYIKSDTEFQNLITNSY